ncbi:MAG: LysM peptidoglycan-binding domain-containing protein [Flavobacteriaceae bacterium]|nr:LysM peptidoglycan-binding domain-containing protein [Flavobacteriaceae bacterium]
MGVKNIFSFFVLLFSLFLCGQTIEENEIQYDSIVSHEVQKKETLFSISKIYGISVVDLLKANPDIKTDKLKRKSILNIPLKKAVKITAIDDRNEELDSVLVISEKDNSLFSKKFKRKNLNVALLAPLKLNSILLDSVDLTKKTLSELNLTTISISFLNGLKSTIKELEERGVKIDLSIYDTENNINKIKELKAQDFSSYDLVIGPFINRNFNEFAQDFDNLIVSPLVNNGIKLKNNVIQTIGPDTLKRKSIYKMIDDRINEIEDQCAIIISDLNNISSANKLLEKFPNAEHIKIDNENLFVDPKITDSLMGINKQNWVFLETSKSNVISSVTSMLSSQKNNERDIKLYSTVSGENYENPNSSLDKLGKISFIYPSNSKPNYNNSYQIFYNSYIDMFGNEPDRISVRARDLTMDLFLRILVYRRLENSFNHGETEYLQNKFNYVIGPNSILNKSFFILEHVDLKVLDYNSKNED